MRGYKTSDVECGAGLWVPVITRPSPLGKCHPALIPFRAPSSRPPTRDPT